MWYRFLSSFILGFLLHKFTYRPTRRFGPKWGLLMRYAIGSLGLVPARLFIWQGLNHDNESERFIISHLLSLFTFGPGVVLGHLLNRKK